MPRKRLGKAIAAQAPIKIDQITVTQFIASLLLVNTPAVVSGKALIFGSSKKRLSK